MAEVFTWRPKIQVPGDVQFAVLQAQFGDGYIQTAADGINNRRQSWNLTFVGKRAVIAAIQTFLNRHAGFKPFEWTPKDHAAALFDVAGYRITDMHNGVWSLQAEFRERFA